MRILHISTRLILGGSQENTVLSCEGQARRGHDVHLAFGPIYGPEGSLLERVQAFRTADGRGITTHVIPNMIRAVNPLADWRALRETKALIRDLMPNVVHTHSSKAGIIGRAAAWEKRSHHIGGSSWNDLNRNAGRMIVDPVLAAAAGEDMDETKLCDAWIDTAVVHTIHGPPFMPVEGGPLARARTRASNLLYTLAERTAARRCHAIVSVADAMTEQFLARGIGNPAQYTTVYSGMEVEPFLTPAPGESKGEVRARLGLAPTDLVIGTVARLAQHKGHDDLLAALADDLKQHPDRKLLWVGDGWWRARLLARARTLGLSIRELDREPPPSSPSHPLTASPSQLLLTGLVPPERIPGLIRAMDILVHPSYREGLPRTVPQALLSGVVPVAYDADGTREVCRDLETGRLIPVGDLDALRGAVDWLALRPGARHMLAARGRRFCQSRFSADRMVDELLRLYERILAAGTPGPAAAEPADAADRAGAPA
ncbi:MAG: glycosyltransferase [Phycisphaerales bacterium]